MGACPATGSITNKAGAGTRIREANLHSERERSEVATLSNVKSLPQHWASTGSFGSIEYLFSQSSERKGRTAGAEKSESTLPADPASVHFAYRVEEHGLLFVDELHQNGRLVMSDVSHIIPPGQKRGDRVGPKTAHAFTSPRRRATGYC